MIVLERDGSLVSEAITVHVTSSERGVIDLSSEVALQQETVIDQLINVMVNVLGLSNVEIRVHDSQSAEGKPLANDES